MPSVCVCVFLKTILCMLCCMCDMHGVCTCQYRYVHCIYTCIGFCTPFFEIGSLTEPEAHRFA